jgi:hypothetical protein
MEERHHATTENRLVECDGREIPCDYIKPVGEVRWKRYHATTENRLVECDGREIPCDDTELVGGV